jgi:hypothetical protein
MKGIKLKSILTSKQNDINFDASISKFEQEKGVVCIADGKQSNGLLSNKWATYLCDKTSISPITSLQGLKLFIDHIWEEFYEENHSQISDAFQKNTFEKYGSLSTYTACWFSQENNKSYYQWLSYGNSAILIYDTKNDELFVPEYKEGLFGFLENKGVINWKEDDLIEKYLLKGSKTELNSHTKIILATDAMAEHLVLSYLIIKSKEDDYWEKLSKVMENNQKLSNLIYNNRSLYSFDTFNEVLDKWDNEANLNNLSNYLHELQTTERIAKDDISLQIVSYNPKDPEFLTTHKPTIIKTYAKPIIPKPVFIPVPKPQPKKVNEFKANKDDYINVLLDNNVLKLFHFTDRSNLAMIKKMGGLYSWDYLERNNISIPKAGGGQLSRMLDARHNLQNFVRTSICQNHPMRHIAFNEGRINDPILLEIDPLIVTLKDSIFSNMNATKNGHKRGAYLEDLKRIKFNLCKQPNYFNLEEHEKPYYQAEVMVREFIPAKYIINLYSF